jgi:hypothetical protein
MQNYNSEFKKVKGSRYVEYYKSKGLITLEVDLEDGGLPITVECNQVHLSILDLFTAEKNGKKIGSLNSNDISRKTGIPKNILPKYLNFWKQNYILKEASNNSHYQLALDEISKKHREKLRISKLQMMEEDNMSEDGQSRSSLSQASSSDIDDIEVIGMDYDEMGLNYEIIRGDEALSKSSRKNKDKSNRSGSSSMIKPKKPKKPTPTWQKAFEQYWNYTKNTIKTGPKRQLTLDQIHKKLIVFSKMEPDSDEDEYGLVDVSVLASKKKLKTFLNTKIKDGEVVNLDEEWYSVVG